MNDDVRKMREKVLAGWPSRGLLLAYAYTRGVPYARTEALCSGDGLRSDPVALGRLASWVAGELAHAGVQAPPGAVPVEAWLAVPATGEERAWRASREAAGRARMAARRLAQAPHTEAADGP